MGEPRHDAEPVFVVTIYGTAYLPFLAPHLLSVERSHPDADEVVLWQDLPEPRVRALQRAFPRVRFLPLEAPIEGGIHQRISRKLSGWRVPGRLYPDRPICFMDVDALVYRPITPFLTGDFDVQFTWKDEDYPLNTGVIVAGTGEVADAFCAVWAERTEAIVSDPRALLRAQAVSGGGDQHALRQIMGFANYDGLFERRVGDRALRFKGVECRFLNETNSVPITEDTHVIHYKSGWHPILLHGAAYSAHRTEELCREMYAFWRETASAAGRRVAEATLSAALEAAGAGGGASGPGATLGALASLLGAERVLTQGDGLPADALSAAGVPLERVKDDDLAAAVRRRGGEPSGLALAGADGEALAESLREALRVEPDLPFALVLAAPNGSADGGAVGVALVDGFRQVCPAGERAWLVLPQPGDAREESRTRTRAERVRGEWDRAVRVVREEGWRALLRRALAESARRL